MSACEEALAAGGALAGAASAGPFEATELTPESTPSAGAPPADAPPAPAGAADVAGAGTPAAPTRPEHPGRRPPTAVLIGGVVVLAAAAVGVVLALGGSSSKTPAPTAQAALRPVPANRVTGAGQVSVRLVGNKATVSLATNGLDGDAELAHAMHIHAGGRGECPPASAAQLHNGHLAIDTNDGIAFYGPPVQSLTTSGNTGVASILVFKRYPVGGTIRYSRTIELPPKVAAEIRDNNAVIVIHGIDYDGSGAYTGVLDRSDLNKQLFATQTAPALCGPLDGATGARRRRRAARHLHRGPAPDTGDGGRTLDLRSAAAGERGRHAAAGARDLSRTPADSGLRICGVRPAAGRRSDRAALTHPERASAADGGRAGRSGVPGLPR